MDKRKKIIYILLIFIIFTGLVSGIGVKKYMDNKNHELIEHFKPSIEIFLKTYYNNIDTVTINTIKRVPTGDSYLRGYVNNDTTLSISAFIDYIEKEENLIPVISYVDVDIKVQKWRKEEFKHTSPYTAYELLEQQKDKENSKKE